MRGIIKTLSRSVERFLGMLFSCILFLFCMSCCDFSKKRSVFKLTDTIRVEDFKLIFNKKDYIMMKVFTSGSSTKNDYYSFYYNVTSQGTFLVKQSLIHKFDLSGRKIFDTIEYTKVECQLNQLYESTLRQTVKKVGDMYLDHLKEYPRPDKEFKFWYSDHYLKYIYEIWFERISF